MRVRRWTIPAAMAVAAVGLAIGGQNDSAPAPGTQMGPPRLDMLADAHVCRDGNGGYYLTGTAGTLDGRGRADFDHNRGAPLWYSTDLKQWQCLGYAWDRVEHFRRTAGRPKLGIWLDWSAPADRIDGLLAQATTSPEFCHVRGAWYLVCAMNGQSILLQKSTTSKAAGPYEDYAYLATRGGHPSLFVDGNTVYLVFSDAWIARLKNDLTELAEPPRPMVPAAGGDPGTGRLTLGMAGVNVFMSAGRYNVLAARWRVRDGKPHCDAFGWQAESVYGPYRPTGEVLLDTGPVSVFQAGDGTWRAVSSRPGKNGPRIEVVR